MPTDVRTELAEPDVVDADGWQVPRPGGDLDELVLEAGLGARLLPPHVDEAILRFASTSNRAGALLLRNVPIGPLPPTPVTPSAPSVKDLSTELALLTVARRLGQPVGYRPEHGGRIVQNLVPVAVDADTQTSTSSRSNLMFHTETAFHPFRPRYLLLLCLRGDPSATTTLASVHDIVDRLDDDELEVMSQPRFRTAVDASFLNGRTNVPGPPHPLLTGTRDEPTFVFDADLTTAADPRADGVLERVKHIVDEVTTGVVLEAGDLLVVDNNVAIHGRSPFTARFDGTDRWLQRAFVVSDLAPSAADRDGRVITTEFGRR
jgi:alpha-ketoglutarate-dependent taurine dioxygenase